MNGSPMLTFWLTLHSSPISSFAASAMEIRRDFDVTDRNRSTLQRHFNYVEIRPLKYHFSSLQAIARTMRLCRSHH